MSDFDAAIQGGSPALLRSMHASIPQINWEEIQGYSECEPLLCAHDYWFLCVILSVILICYRILSGTLNKPLNGLSGTRVLSQDWVLQCQKEYFSTGHQAVARLLSHMGLRLCPNSTSYQYQPPICTQCVFPTWYARSAHRVHLRCSST